jgi:hypothetical protein
MPPVTIADVRLICPTGLSDAQVEACITMATSYVTPVLGPQNLDAQLLWAITTQLSAHFVCMADPRAKSVSDGDTSVQLQRGQDGTGFASTQYGQVALALDPTGTLRDAQTKKRMVIKLY